MTPHAPEPPAASQRVSPYVAARPLRAFLGRHNRQALLLTCISLVGALLLWAIMYGFAYWFTLVTFTIDKSFNSNTVYQIRDTGLLNERFPWCFAAGAAAYLGVAAVMRHHYRTDKIREAGMYFFWVLLELFLAVPNVTFSVWGNLRAITKLGKIEVGEAWRLLQRMNEEEGRLSLTSLRLEIEDERVLCRVVFALQLVGLVGIRENRQGWFLYLQGQEVRALLARAA